MSRGRAIEAGRAAVRFIGDRSPLQRAIRLAEQDLREFGRSVGKIGQTLTTAAVATTSAFAIPVRDALRLQEALSGLDAAFGKEASSARGFLTQLQKELNLSQRAAADALTGFQRFFRGMGFGEQDAAALSQRMTTIAADLSAAGDISFDESAGRIRSALTGSTTVLDQFGINLKQSAIEAEALAQGIKKSTGDLTSYERAMINASLITQQFASNGILGAAQREADSTAGVIRGLKNQVADLSAAIGSALLPAIRPMVLGIKDVVKEIGNWVAESEQLLQSAAKTVAIVGALGVAMQVASKGIQAMAASIGVLRSTLILFTQPMTLVRKTVLLIGAAFVVTQKDISGWAAVAKRSFERFTNSFQALSQAVNSLDIGAVFRVLALTIERELLALGQEFGNFGAAVVSVVTGAFKALATILHVITESFKSLVGTVHAVATAFNLATESSNGFFSQLSEKQKRRIQEINQELQKLKGQAEDTTATDKKEAPKEATGSGDAIFDQKRRLAESMRHLPAGIYPDLEIFNARARTVFSAIGRTLKDDAGSVGIFLKGNLEVAKQVREEFGALVQSGKKFIKQSELGVLQRRLAELQKRAFRMEVATTFSSSALREAFGIGTGDVDQEQLEVQKEMRDLLRKIDAKKSLIAVL